MPQNIAKDRYSNLTAAIDEIYARGVRYLRFLEIGTYDGVRASSLFRHWRQFPGKPLAGYYGFDMFAEMTLERARAEFSKSKLPPAREVVADRISREGVVPNLFQGNTHETLPKFVPELPEMHLIFVDGGHSLETIQSDWNAIQSLIGTETIVILDDYYCNRRDYGCKVLVDGLGPKFRVTHLDPVDHIFSTKLEIRMIRVTKAP